MVQDGKLDPLHFIRFTINILKNKTQNDVSVVNQIISLANLICLNYILLENQSGPKSMLYNLITDLIFEHPIIKDILINKLLDIIDTSRIEQTELIARSMEKVKISVKSNNLADKCINLESISSVKSKFKSDNKVKITRDFVWVYCY